MVSIKHALSNFFPVITLFFVTVILFWANYEPNTFLTGWDNLHPEYGFWLNIKHSLVSVWQQYQGLGLLGGMGHAAELPHQLMLLALSYILPLNVLRYVLTFLLLFVGGAGAYFLINKLLFSNTHNNKLFALIGGLFYMLNLATVQTFYAPYEPFIFHFAFLPWLLAASVLYVTKKSKKIILFLTIILLISMPQAYLPTLFVVYLLSLGITFFTLLTQTPSKKLIIRMFQVIVITMVINAFWLLPFLYFSTTNAKVNINSKINQMATDYIYAQNKEFGNIQDVITLKGFWFNNVDPDKNGAFSYMLEPWRNYQKNNIPSIASYVLFLVILAGSVWAFKKRESNQLPFAVLFVFSFTMLTIATPPFSWINTLFRMFPLFNQAFRFPFTKFASLATLTFACMLSLGFDNLFRIFSKKVYKANPIFIFFLFLILCVIVVFPVFEGNLFYEKERLVMPSDYQRVFSFFKSQPEDTRILNLPQPTFWGWAFYRWGYGGSGFLWHGISQPILDNAFNVWSQTDENFNFEITNALYSNNSVLIYQTLQKYQIDWMMLDKSIINPAAPKAVFTLEIKKLIEKIPSIQKSAEFGNIEIYKVKLEDNPSHFVFTTGNLPHVNRYQTTDVDQAYLNLGTYISVPENTPSNDYTYPLRNLFSNKNTGEKTYSIEQTQNSIRIKTSIPLASQATLVIPNYVGNESIIPVSFYLQKDTTGKKNIQLITMEISTPSITVDGRKIYGSSYQQPLFQIAESTEFPLYLDVNGVANFTIPHASEKKTLLGQSFLILAQDNILSIQDKDGKATGVTKITSDFISSLSLFNRQNIAFTKGNPSASFIIDFPKIKDSYLGYEINPDKKAEKTCEIFNTFRKGVVQVKYENNSLVFKSQNATGCASFFLNTLSHYLSYVLFINAENVKGKGLQFWLLNEDQKNSPIAEYLPSDKNKGISSFILPPQEQFGKSYSLHFDNISLGGDETINKLSQISVYPIPYSFITSLFFEGNNAQKLEFVRKQIQVEHINDSLYSVTLKQSDDPTVLVLSQSFDKGWKAYQLKTENSKLKTFLARTFPFLFGKEIKNHVEINNWENGWILNKETMKQGNNLPAGRQGETIVLVYLPQYLQYAGYVILASYAMWLFYYLIKR